VRVSPTIEADNLYALLEDGWLLALDLQTGKDKWVRHLTGPLSEVLALPERVYVRSPTSTSTAIVRPTENVTGASFSVRSFAAILRRMTSGSTSRPWTTRFAPTEGATASCSGTRPSRSGRPRVLL
jgi:outer membrane protein assembly factor BamB